jgi:hypothetical protein
MDHATPPFNIHRTFGINNDTPRHVYKTKEGDSDKGYLIDGSDREIFLYGCITFKRIAARRNWESNQRFIEFERLLQGPAINHVWENVKNDVMDDVSDKKRLKYAFKEFLARFFTTAD